MIKLQRSIVHGINAATKKEDLHEYLQNAVMLEHSTIPPYLTAMFSLKPGVNDMIANMIRSIVVEEMLHMTIVANILIAIGGHPQINTRGFVPKYPGPLPMSIGGADFTVGIEAFSKELVQNTFMKIEEPEEPIPIKTKLL
ncbi:MAG TPA: ferritin-like protein, partial [Burkholderiales bacterium]|nr:ferritin-like protein [Burkholderiales bacterium]